MRGWLRPHSPAPSLTPPSLCSLLDTSTRRVLFRNISAFLSQPTNIEDKRAQISRNCSKFKKWHTRGDISHTVWDVCSEPNVAFHIQQRRSPRLTTERHSKKLTCILAPDQWVCREASELPLVAPVNAEPHNKYVSSLLLLLRVFHPSTRGTTGIPLSGPVEGSELLYASRNPSSHS